MHAKVVIICSTTCVRHYSFGVVWSLILEFSSHSWHRVGNLFPMYALACHRRPITCCWFLTPSWTTFHTFPQTLFFMKRLVNFDTCLHASFHWYHRLVALLCQKYWITCMTDIMREVLSVVLLGGVILEKFYTLFFNLPMERHWMFSVRVVFIFLATKFISTDEGIY